MVQQRVTAWVAERTGLGADEIGEDSPLFSSGLLDSFELLELVTFLESLTGRHVGPMDINLANFDTIGRVSNFFGR